MGCFGDHEKGEIEESQKWEYVTLSDFRAKGALAYLSYAWLWVLALISCAVYGADTFTAVNLLAFDKWSGSVQPAIDIKYAKWIFGVCIIVSWVLCLFEWIRAVRIIRRGGVADSYMDSLAVSLQSMRPQGWRRFLVFGELTKSRKGMDYTALFVYFSFKGAIRIILAEAPRQCVNAFTLYSFMETDLLNTGGTNQASFSQFWANVGSLAESDHEQAVVLFTMLFTLVIWVISALCLLTATVLYLLFLWHWIPKKDGRLGIYCRRKVDRRLEKIVGEKVKQALEDQEKKRLREEQRVAKKGGELPSRPIVNRKPTLPQIAGKTPDVGDGAEFGIVDTALIQRQRLPPSRSNTTPLPLQRQPTMPDLGEPGDRPQMSSTRNFTAPANTLQRQATLPDLQVHSGRPTMPPPTHNSTLQREPTLPDLDTGRPPMAYRSDTQASALSNATYSSDAPLINHADDMGYSDDVDYFPTQPRPTLDRQASYSNSRMAPPLETKASYASVPMQPSRDRQTSYATVPMSSLDRQGSYATAPHPVDRQASYATAPSSFDRQASYASRPMLPRSMTPSSRQMSQDEYDARNDIRDYHPNYATETTTPISPVREDALPQRYGTPSSQVPQNYPRTPSPQQPRAPPTGFQRPFPLVRTGTGLSFSSRHEPEAVEQFEMQPQPRPDVSPVRAHHPQQSASPHQVRPHPQPRQQTHAPAPPFDHHETYVAFNPGFAPPPAAIARPQLPSGGPARSTTAPPSGATRTGERGSFPPAAPLQRSATAPPPEAAGPYDDLLAEYASDAEVRHGGRGIVGGAAPPYTRDDMW